MNLILNSKIPEFADRLEEADPTLKDCVLIVITVKTDGTMDMVSNCPEDDLDRVLDYAKGGGPGKVVTTGEETVN